MDKNLTQYNTDYESAPNITYSQSSITCKTAALKINPHLILLKKESGGKSTHNLIKLNESIKKFRVHNATTSRNACYILPEYLEYNHSLAMTGLRKSISTQCMPIKKRNKSIEPLNENQEKTDRKTKCIKRTMKNKLKDNTKFDLIKGAVFDLDANVNCRPYMEDFINFNDTINDYKVYVLCDGHGGSLASSTASKQIPEIFNRIIIDMKNDKYDKEDFIQEAIKKTLNEIEEILKSMNKKPISNVIDLNNIKEESNNPDNEEDVEEDDTNEELEHGGTTVNFVFICKEGEKRYIYSANLGDSRTILIRKNNSYRLSYDHKSIDPEEMKRVRSEKGKIINKRFYGILAITRCLADFGLKKGYKGLSIEPHITKTEILDDDKYLIIASDGLWDVINDDKAFELLKDENIVNTDGNLAKYLIKKSLDYGTKDNVSCILIKLN